MTKNLAPSPLEGHRGGGDKFSEGLLTCLFLFSCGHATLQGPLLVRWPVGPSVRDHESKSVKTHIPPLPTRPQLVSAQLVLAVYPALFLW